MTMGKPKVLVVDDKKAVLDLLVTILAAYDVTVVSESPRAALALMDRQPFDVVLTDVRMPDADGHEVLETVKTAFPDTEVVMMTGYATVSDAVAAMRLGAFDYLEKPFDPDDVLLAVARALEHRRQRLRALAERRVRGGEEETGASVSLSYREAVEASRERASRSYLVALMREFEGNVTAAAERAGMERESLHRLLRGHGLRPDDFRGAAREGGRGPLRPTGEHVGG